MTKPTKKDRIAANNKIEDILNAFCRSCVHEDSRKSESVCNSCPVSGGLRAQGNKIDSSVEVAMKLERQGVRAKWTNEEDVKLLEFRKNKVSYSNISKEIGKSSKAVYSRLRTMRDNGIIDENHMLIV